MAGIDWQKIREKLPTDKTAEEKAKRMKMFEQFDPNGNGYLSLAEVDKGMRDVVGLYEIFECKPVIMRAFQAARHANDSKNKKGSHGPDYIEKCEFRLLLWYVKQYFEIWQMFEAVDTSGDHRVDINEFKRAIPKMAEWGVEIKDPQAEFNTIDTNHGGQILFDEFAAYALRKGLDLLEDDEHQH
jgi:Ca2+-binding EF-hand superfamily protein